MSVATSAQSTRSRTWERVYASVMGLAAVAVILQGLWAGIFLEHDGERDAAESWVDVHARGADVAIVLVAVATVIAFVKLRARRDLWLGGAVLAALLVLESFIGGLVRDSGKDTLTAVHVPLALALMALLVWLTMRIRRGRASIGDAYPAGSRQERYGARV